MTKTELRSKLTAALSRLYIASEMDMLAEFWQGEMRILYAVSEAQGKKTAPSELSELLRLSRSRITVALDSLRRKGYVRLETEEEDRRRKYVELTDEGRRFYAAKVEGVSTLLDYLIGELGESNALLLADLADKAVAITENYKEKN